MGIRNFISEHFDFRFYGVSVIAFIVAVGIIPVVMYVDPFSRIGYENGLLENIQMAILFAGCWLEMRGSIDKKLACFITMLLGIIILREVNYGRTLFFPIPGQENAFYSWKDIKYGYLAHPIFGLYIAWVVIYFFKNKLFLLLWRYIREVRIPVWSVLLTALGGILSLYTDKAVHNYVFEEMSEVLLYTGLLGLIWLYSYNENFRLKDKE